MVFSFNFAFFVPWNLEQLSCLIDGAVTTLYRFIAHNLSDYTIISQFLINKFDSNLTDQVLCVDKFERSNNVKWRAYSHQRLNLSSYEGNGGSTGPVRIGRGNLSRGKGTRQSSTAYRGSSSRAVDGNKNSQWGGRSCTHTHSQPNAWWRVDLGADYRVGTVKLTNRGDCCGNRLRNFDIRVGNRDGNPKVNALYVFYRAVVCTNTALKLQWHSLISYVITHLWLYFLHLQAFYQVGFCYWLGS